MSLIALVNDHTGAGFRFAGHCGGGQVGAAYVSWPDGRQSVLTWQPGGTAERQEEIARILDIARTAGIPTPRYELVTAVGEDVAIVQERLPGTAPDRVDGDVVRAMIRLSELSTGLLAEVDAPARELYLRYSGPGFCIHETLETYSAGTRRLLARIREIGADAPLTMPGNDLVHCDFHPGNVLVDADGQITGVIDWDGAGRGDRHFDLVTLRFGLESYPTTSEAVRLADEAMPTDPAYWAHMSLRMVDWAIRHFTESEVDKWVAFAATSLRTHSRLTALESVHNQGTLRYAVRVMDLREELSGEH